MKFLQSELCLLKKQHAILVHQDNLRDHASMIEARPDLPCPQPAELVQHGGGGQADVTDQPFQPVCELGHVPGFLAHQLKAGSKCQNVFLSWL